MASSKKSKLPNIAIVVGIILGTWGAGLSTYQEFRSWRAQRPSLYTKLEVTRPDADEPNRPATFEVTISNVGRADVAVSPNVTIFVHDPSTGATIAANATFQTEKSFGLPKTVRAGEDAVAIGTVDSSDRAFGVNLLYRVALQTTEGALFITDNLAGPVDDPKAVGAMKEFGKYQSRIEFNAKPVLRVAL